MVDLKATALLKLIYLEMFGHDMSWASFNVLEVMSSQKYLQKRVGYLGAVQSFRSDTEVLMLATNLLKKVRASLPVTPDSIDLSLGHNVCFNAYDFFAADYFTSHRDAFYCIVITDRPVASSITFEPQYKEKDCRIVIPSCANLS